MRRGINIVTCIFIAFAGNSCKKSFKVDEYVKYINDKKNGLDIITTIEGWQYNMQYHPYGYVALLETGGGQNDSLFKKRIAELHGTVWFNIKIRRYDNSVTPLRYGITNQQEYDGRLNYFLNDARKDIVLVYGIDTLHPDSYLFETNYNLTPEETIVVGFILPQKEDIPERPMQLSYTDRIFKNGIIKGTYSQKTLNHIPNLIY